MYEEGATTAARRCIWGEDALLRVSFRISCVAVGCSGNDSHSSRRTWVALKEILPISAFCGVLDHCAGAFCCVELSTLGDCYFRYTKLYTNAAARGNVKKSIRLQSQPSLFSCFVLVDLSLQDGSLMWKSLSPPHEPAGGTDCFRSCTVRP